ncbi:MAG: hypothetical protein QUU85_10575, partial [Candidatus Eisenbacteria bacterium]|nr:hypothetical protein [Candidatus Eisenbacteria bacterium]
MSASWRCPLFVAALFLFVASAAGAAAFDFVTGPTYQNVASSETYVEFTSMLKSNFPSGDVLHVELYKHMPGTWFAQFCQVSTGICYFDSADITLRNDEVDHLRFDFFLPEGDVNKGWMEVRISRVADPTTFVEATFAVGHGIVLPPVSLHFTTSDAFQRGDPGDTIEMYGDLASGNAFDDSLYVQAEKAIPQGWFSQFCQMSTGICYWQDQATIELPAHAHDQLRLDFFTDQNPDIGVIRLKVHSLTNPAVWFAIPFRAETAVFVPSAESDSKTQLRAHETAL